MKAILETPKIAWRMARHPMRAVAIVEQGNFWWAQCEQAFAEASAAFANGDKATWEAARERFLLAHRRATKETEELFR